MPPIRYERFTIMELLLQIGGTPGHGDGQFNEPRRNFANIKKTEQYDKHENNDYGLLLLSKLLLLHN